MLVCVCMVDLYAAFFTDGFRIDLSANRIPEYYDFSSGRRRGRPRCHMDAGRVVVCLSRCCNTCVYEILNGTRMNCALE